MQNKSFIIAKHCQTAPRPAENKNSNMYFGQFWHLVRLANRTLIIKQKHKPQTNCHLLIIMAGGMESYMVDTLVVIISPAEIVHIICN